MSNFYIGTEKPKSIYVGESKVKSLYLGTEKVWEAGGGRLPSAYQEVEWIGNETDGSARLIPYITTNYEIQLNTIIKLKYIRYYNYGSYDTWSSPFGTGVGNSQMYILANKRGETTTYYTFGSYNKGNLAFDDLSLPVEVEASSTGVKVNGTTKLVIQNQPTVSAPAYPITLFGRTIETGVDKCKCRIWYFQAYEGETLVLDLVPCYRKSDSEIGMYDTVSDTFYTNAGGGTFTKGGDIS